MKRILINWVLLGALFFTSCNTSKMTFGNSSSWLPQDFDAKKTVLLVERFRTSEKANKQMEDYMKSSYPYKYEFVDKETILSHQGKYSDTKIYKFALRYSSHLNDSPSGSTPINTGFDFNFFDRSTGKEYPRTKKGSSYVIMTFKPVINTIVKQFE